MKVVASGFLDTEPTYLEAHAATIVQTQHGLVAAWFAGSKESRPDVAIWLGHHDGTGWQAPRKLFTGSNGAGSPLPCWNPVLHQCHNGPLLLFYKVGPRPWRWWGMLARSEDGGQTWSRARRLPDGIFGPTKNKPLELPDGSLLIGSSSEYLGWRCQIERLDADLETFERVAVLNHSLASLPGGFKAIQAALVDYGHGRVRAMCRTRQGFISECWSTDRGQSWSTMQATALPHPNSGFDCDRLKDGRLVLAHHPQGESRGARGRGRLLLSVSADGQAFTHVLTLEDEPGREFSYPSLLQSDDGLLHVVYTWRRKRIRHVVIEAAEE